MIVHNPTAWGYIPSFIRDRRPIPEQIAKHYIGGWLPFEGFEVRGKLSTSIVIEYPGDPPLTERGRIYHAGQLLIIFPYAWCLWLPDATELANFQIARMD